MILQQKRRINKVLWNEASPLDLNRRARVRDITCGPDALKQDGGTCYQDRSESLQEEADDTIKYGIEVMALSNKPTLSTNGNGNTL
jgi:hypothetical protein